MPTGLVALLDDVSVIARAAAASLDDVSAAAAKAGTKAAGVVIDDAAVTPSYVTEFTPDRELPVIARIAKGSLFNNGHVALAKDMIFGLCIWDGDNFVPLSEGDQSELDRVRGLINKGNHPFMWWDEFNAVKPRTE